MRTSAEESTTLFDCFGATFGRQNVSNFNTGHFPGRFLNFARILYASLPGFFLLTHILFSILKFFSWKKNFPRRTVVAVFVDNCSKGPDWQFLDFPFTKYVGLFKMVRGFYAHYKVGIFLHNTATTCTHIYYCPLRYYKKNIPLYYTSQVNKPNY